MTPCEVEMIVVPMPPRTFGMCLASTYVRRPGRETRLRPEMTDVRLPARLRHAGDEALVGELAQADPAQPELAVHGPRAPAPPAAAVRPGRVLGLAVGPHDHGCLGHLKSLVSAYAATGSPVSDSKPAGRPSRANGMPSASRSANASASVCALVAQRDGQPDRHALAQLERRDRLPRPADVRLLAGDVGELARGRLEHLRVLLGLAHAHVERDLRQAGSLHRRGVLELAHQRGADLVVVAVLESCHVSPAPRPSAW